MKKPLTLATLTLALVACGPVLKWKSGIEGAVLTGTPLSLTADANSNTYQLYPQGTQLALRKLDANGKPLWSTVVDATLTDSLGASSIKATSTGVVVGYGTGTTAAFVRSFDASGNTLWSSDLGTHTAEAISDMAVGNDGSLLVSLRQSNTRSNLLKLDANGALVWDTVVPACSLYCVSTFAQNDAGQILVTQAEATATKSHLVDPAGTVSWSRTRSTGLSLNGIVPSQAVASANGFVVTHPVTTWEYDLSGNTTWSVAFGGKARPARTPAGLLLVGNGNKVTTLDSVGTTLSEQVLEKVETVTQIEWREDIQRLLVMTNSRDTDLSVLGIITDTFYPSLWTFDATGKQVAKYNGAATLTSGAACQPFPSCTDVAVTPGDLWQNFAYTPNRRVVISGLVRESMRYASSYTVK